MNFFRLLKTWGFGILLGAAVSYFFYGKGSETIIAGLFELSGVPKSENLLVSVFFKNSLASLTTIFLGPLLCMLELWIYTGVSTKTYDFFERLSDPIYRVLSIASPIFGDLGPFFRSCYFYLVFVPYFSIFVNGAVFGFLFGHYYRGGLAVGYLTGLFPHAAVEIPAMFASAALALVILDRLKNQIISGDVSGLRDALKMAVGGVIQTMVLIQIALLFAAFLESSL